MQISLIYANVTEDDILLRSELDFKARINGDKFRVFYTLDKPPEGGFTAWSGWRSTTCIPLSAPCTPRSACRCHISSGM